MPAWLALVGIPIVAFIIVLIIAIGHRSRWAWERYRAFEEGERPDERLREAAQLWTILLIVAAIAMVACLAAGLSWCADVRLV